jgi:hypothetical protein
LLSNSHHDVLPFDGEVPVLMRSLQGISLAEVPLKDVEDSLSARVSEGVVNCVVLLRGLRECYRSQCRGRAPQTATSCVANRG